MDYKIENLIEELDSYIVITVSKKNISEVTFKNKDKAYKIIIKYCINNKWNEEFLSEISSKLFNNFKIQTLLKKLFEESKIQNIENIKMDASIFTSKHLSEFYYLIKKILKSTKLSEVEGLLESYTSLNVNNIRVIEKNKFNGLLRFFDEKFFCSLENSSISEEKKSIIKSSFYKRIDTFRNKIARELELYKQKKNQEREDQARLKKENEKKIEVSEKIRLIKAFLGEVEISGPDYFVKYYQYYVSSKKFYQEYCEEYLTKFNSYYEEYVIIPYEAKVFEAIAHLKNIVTSGIQMKNGVNRSIDILDIIEYLKDDIKIHDILRYIREKYTLKGVMDINIIKLKQMLSKYCNYTSTIELCSGYSSNIIIENNEGTYQIDITNDKVITQYIESNNIPMNIHTYLAIIDRYKLGFFDEYSETKSQRI